MLLLSPIQPAIFSSMQWKHCPFEVIWNRPGLSHLRRIFSGNNHCQVECINELKPSRTCFLTLIPCRPCCKAKVHILIWGRNQTLSLSRVRRTIFQVWYKKYKETERRCSLQVTYKLSHAYLLWILKKRRLRRECT
jgi:hypothetical protein